MKHQDKYRHYLSGYGARGVRGPRLPMDVMYIGIFDFVPHVRFDGLLWGRWYWIWAKNGRFPETLKNFWRTWVMGMLVGILLYGLIF